MTAVEVVAKKFKALRSSLTERGRRLWAGTEADALGRGGVAWVAKATGMAISTVRKGRDEVRAEKAIEVVRDRRSGAGRHRLEKKDPQVLAVLDSLVNPTTRGDPESPLRWTCKSARVLARELTSAGHAVGRDKIRQLLKAAGYSLMGNAKTKEEGNHPDRNAQFEFINARAQGFISRGLPVISVDAKKKELVGEYANHGREWQRKGEPVEVLTHDYCSNESHRKATPYGIYDVAQNIGFVNVGTDNNTPAFAVRSIGKWWEQMGRQRYPAAKELFITADAGGSNGPKPRVWKADLQSMADRTGLTIHVSHFPPGTSKWNKIEHRLFSFISINWRGRPLVNYETVVSLIAATTTAKGLTVSAELDPHKYPLGITVEKHVMEGLQLERSNFHGEWNYTLHPRSEAQQAASEICASIRRLSTSQAERRNRWIKLILEQQHSGLSIKRFCREHDINVYSFFWARRRLVGQTAKRSSAAK